MNKRAIVAIMWFLVGCYGGWYLALLLGASDLIGPLLGVVLAAFFAGDPLRVIWTSKSAEAKAARTTYGAPTTTLDL